MNLAKLAAGRAANGAPVRVALIGAGKFGSMFLSQVPHTPGLEVPVIVDLDPQRARDACRTVGWDDARIAATNFTADGMKAMSGDIEVVVEATGNPAVGIRHARAAIAAGKHIVMVNVEADVLAGPLLAEEARSVRRDAQRELVEVIERRAQMVWIPVTVAALVPGVIFMAVPFVQALSLFSGG